MFANILPILVVWRVHSEVVAGCPMREREECQSSLVERKPPFWCVVSMYEEKGE